jgi:hypothetical protein
VSFNKILNEMKRIAGIIGMLMLIFAFTVSDAQDNSTGKKKQNDTNYNNKTKNTDRGTGAGTINSTNQETSGNPRQGDSDARSAEDEKLLGDDNRKAKGDLDDNDNATDNRPAGNPNNTSSQDGGNRQSTQERVPGTNAVPSVNPHGGANQDVTTPGSPQPADQIENTNQTGVGSDQSGQNNASGQNTNQADTTNSGSADNSLDKDSGAGAGANTMGAGTSGAASGEVSADPTITNTPAVNQETSSQSGSPAVLSTDKGSDRDGTNNVQRAEPNMAGAKVNGVKSGNKSVDEDKEIRKGTMQQQGGAQPNDVSTAQNKNAQTPAVQDQNAQTGNNENMNSGTGTSGQTATTNVDGASSNSTKQTTSKRNRNVTGQNNKTQAEAANLEKTGANANRYEGQESDDQRNQQAADSVQASDQGEAPLVTRDEKSNKEKRRERREKRRNKKNRTID